MSDMLSPHEPLGRLVDDSVGDLDEAATDATPDFADVLARARRLAPQRLGRSRVQLGRRLERMPTDELDRLAEVGDLQMLVDDARAQLAEAADAVEPGPTPLPMGPPRTGRTRAVAAAFVAVAAVVVAALALGWGLRPELLRDAEEALPSTASRDADSASNSTPERARVKRPRVRPAPASDPEAEPERAEEPEPVVEPTPTPPRTRRPGARKAKNPLAALDAEARAAWRAGELSRAEQGFREIVRRGGRGKLADLAYGDLFELARQRGRRAEEARLWRAYLRRFPRGSYADDARAGLCRRAQGDDAVRCWKAYLQDRPRGTYRAHAERVLERAGQSH